MATPPTATAPSSSSANKRPTILPPGSSSSSVPRPPVSLAPSVTIAESAILTGAQPISIGSDSVVHPRARIDSCEASITIGRRCIVHERAHLGVPSRLPASPGAGAGGGVPGVLIHDCVTVEVGAVVEAGGTVIGEGTTVGVGCRIGRGATIGKVSPPAGTLFAVPPAPASVNK